MPSILLLITVLSIVTGVVLIIQGRKEMKESDPLSPSQRARGLAERNQRLTRAGDDESAIYEEMALIEEQRQERARPRVLPSVTQFVSSNSALGRLEEDLIQLKSPWRASELLAASLGLALLVFIILAALGQGMFSLLIALPVLLLPWGYVKFMRGRYYRAFDEQLADALLLMANSLRAGFSFMQALETVSHEARQPLADEFHRVTQEISIGVPTNQALENLRMRINSMDLNLVVTAVIIQREVGGGMAEILEVISEVIRERLRIKGEIQVLTTQGRYTGMLLAALPLMMLLLLHIVSSPQTAPGEGSYVSILWTDPRGIWLLAIAAFLQILGFAVIMKVVAIKV
jgi:tight adherence protein B